MSDVGNPLPENPQERSLPVGALKALAHPLRMRMYSYLNDHGAATATVLAEALGESTGQTSYHLRQMERHGMIEEDSARNQGRERWWKAVGYRADYTDIQDDSVAKAALAAVSAHQVQHQTNLILNWINSLQTYPGAWLDGSMLSGSTLDLTSEEFQALTQDLLTLINEHKEKAEKARADADPSGTRSVRIQINAFPLPE